MRATRARCGSAWPKAALGLLGVAALGACTLPTTNRYHTLRDDWTRAHAAASEAGNDRLFEGAFQLERAALVQAVLDRNPTLRAARYAWRAALERVPQVRALDDPVLGAGVAPRSIGSSRVDDAPKFDLSQRIPFPGKLALRGEMALAEAEGAAHDYRAARLRLAEVASQLFDDYYLATRSLEINREHMGLLEELRHVAGARYEAGDASQQDPIQAEVRWTHALHREVMLESSQRVTVERINALLHRPPRSALPPPPPRLASGGEAPPEAPQIIDEAFERKPELAAAQARVGAEQSRLELARREFLPDFTLVGSYNRLWQEPHLQPFVGLQVNVPLQLGRRRAAVAEAEARLEMARSEQVAVEDEVRRAVQSGVDRLEEARHVERLFRDRLLPAARDRIAAARSGFETGSNSFLALIDAERNLLDVELGYEAALVDLGRRRAELDRARGRIAGLGW